MEDHVSPRLRQVLQAQPSRREQALVLLSVVEPHSLNELAALLECTRAELMAELGPCVSDELVRFSRLPEDEGVHWYATAKGRTVGNEIYAKTARALPDLELLEPELAPSPQPTLTDDSVEAAEPRRPGKRRRVVIGEREQPGERVFSFE